MAMARLFAHRDRRSRPVAQSPIDAEVLKKIDQLRAIQVSSDADTNRSYNNLMDDSWRFFRANRAAVLPILRNELTAEVQKPQPNDLVLLDIGYFVYSDADPTNQRVRRAALFKLNPGSPMVRSNLKELFAFCHSVAEAGDPGVLTVVDRSFLTTQQEILLPESVMILDGSQASAFIYGVYGPESELIFPTCSRIRRRGTGCWKY